MTTVTFVTSNKKKLDEVRAILYGGSNANGRPQSFEIVSKDIDLPELQGSSPAEVAKEKCKLAAIAVKGPVMIEDTSLCFNALNGLPGIYIKWFLQSVGHEGLNNLLAAYTDKSAYAQCIFAYTAGPDSPILVFDGQTHGRIVSAKRLGDSYFGWDPIFQPDGFDETYAEMSKEIKNTISHRYRALDKLRTYLNAAGTIEDGVEDSVESKKQML